MARSWKRLGTLVGFNLVFTVVLCEILLRLVPLDIALALPLFYYVESSIHRRSENPRLLFELKPGIHAGDRNRVVHVNSLGFRDPERSPAKPPGVFRVVVLGASNTYGSAVEDDQTFPAELERLLDGRLQGPVEVWNAGVSAYASSQIVESARLVTRDYDPDLLIVQCGNRGREAFLSPGRDETSFPAALRHVDEIQPYLQQRPELWSQQLKRLPFGAEVGTFPIVHSALWRALVVAWNRVTDTPTNEDFNDDSWRFANRSIRELRDLQSSGAPNVRIVTMGYPYGWDCGWPAVEIDSPRYLPPGAEKAFQEIHPPARVYRWYAMAIAKELERLGVLPPLAPPLPSDEAIRDFVLGAEGPAAQEQEHPLTHGGRPSTMPP